MEKAMQKVTTGNGNTTAETLKIVERVLSIEKLNLHLSQPHLINDVVNIIKEEAKN